MSRVDFHERHASHLPVSAPGGEFCTPVLLHNIVLLQDQVRLTVAPVCTLPRPPAGVPASSPPPLGQAPCPYLLFFCNTRAFLTKYSVLFEEGRRLLEFHALVRGHCGSWTILAQSMTSPIDIKGAHRQNHCSVGAVLRAAEMMHLCSPGSNGQEETLEADDCVGGKACSSPACLM